jgi:formamidase
MAGVITIKFSVMKGGMKQLDMKSPIYIPGPVEPQFGPGRYIYFEGFSVDEHGKQHYLDTTVAYRQTCLRVIEYLRRFGTFWFSWFFFLLSTLPYLGSRLTTLFVSRLLDPWYFGFLCWVVVDEGGGGVRFRSRYALLLFY